jgi:leader peptidase (prepilin peptidase)/N-methyltransferase
MAVAGIALFGLAVGSFLNVVIARLPAGRSIVSPGSACPGCGVAIAWYDNVPVASWVLLGARCRHCGGCISWRYPVVEALTAVLFALAFLRRGWGLELPGTLALIAALIVITGIDLDHQIIPDVITFPGIAVGFLLSLLPGGVSWLEALIGIALGGAIFFLIIVASRGGMGGGDMKLGAMLGAFLGWKLALVGFMIAALVGGVVAIALLLVGRKGRKDPVPFGPFLALGGLLSLLWGREILAWYLGAFRG